MNILFLTSTFPYENDNSQSPFVWEQAIAWKKARSLDNIFILAPHYGKIKQYEEIDSIKIFRFKYWWPVRYETLAYPSIIPNLKRNPFLIFQLPFFLLFQFISTMNILKKYEIDLIYAHWITPQGLTAYLCHWFKKIPYVLQNHSLDIKVMMRVPLFGRWIIKKIVSRSFHLFCVNTELAEQALKIDPDSSAKISVLPMGFCDRIVGETRDENRLVYDIGFIGRLSLKKGVQCLLKALEPDHDGFKNLKIGIAGSGELENELKKAAKKTGKNIYFLGFLKNEEKNTFFNTTNIFIFPSLKLPQDVEGLPVALLEALIFNKPVIASRATNIELLPEWPLIKNTVTLLDDPTDSDEFAQKIFETINCRHSPGKDRTILKRYLWNNLINEYFEIIKPLFHD